MAVNLAGFLDGWTLGDTSAVPVGIPSDSFYTTGQPSTSSSGAGLSGFLSALTSLGTTALQGFAPNYNPALTTQYPVVTGTVGSSISPWLLIAAAVVLVVILSEKH